MAPENDDVAAGQDEVRRRFKEALERKHGGPAGSSAEDGARKGPSLHSSTGPAKQQRTFRRKSGG